MKNIVCRTILCSILGIGLCPGQSISLKEKRVSFEAEGIPASEAIGILFINYKIQNISSPELAAYRIGKVKCQEIHVVDCLKKILYKLPFDISLNKDNNIVFIRKETRKGVFNLFGKNGTDTIIKPQQSLMAVGDIAHLNNNINKIDEIVLNAGYYNVKDKERTGSIAKVTAKEIENQPVTNVLSTVQGRMAGVNITQKSGVPGGGYTVEIRGRNSLRPAGDGNDPSEPLYVVDGVPIGQSTVPKLGPLLPGGYINPLNSIAPDDIESIEVLKDADATAIYGSRGANGVVLITTKKGKAGKVKVTLNTGYGISQIISNLTMMNTEQYLRMRKQAYLNDGISNYPANAYDLNGTWDQSRYTDWQKVLIGHNATTSNIQASVTGGSETTSFLISLGHLHQTTVFPGDFAYKSSTISSNLNHRSRDNKFQLNMSNLFSMQGNNQVRTDFTRQAFSLNPVTPKIYNADGSLNWENNTFDNPLSAVLATYSNENLQFLNNLNLSYEFLPGLSAKVNGGVNYQTLEELTLSPHTMYNPSWGLTSANSQAGKNDHKRLSYIIEPQLNWRLKLNNHKLDVLVGGSYQQESNKQFSINGFGFQSNAFMQNVGAATTKVIRRDVRNIYKYVAVFGRINYQFKNRYILNLTGRRDGSSRFGPNNKFANFGAVGAAWIFSNEPFLKDSKWLSFGKLRTSYGLGGSDNIGDYQYLDTYTVSPLVYDGVTSLLPSRLYNPDYSWEKTKKLEAALELGLFKNLLNTSVAWYRNRSSSQLVGYQLPGTTGFSSVLANLPATVENTGLEIELSAKPLNGGNLKWESGFNISFPKNKLISFPGLEGSSYANRFMVGMPTTIVKVYQYEGIDPNTGLYRFTDYNGDGKINSPNDNKAVENIGVKFFGGWNNQFRYKNWDFSFLFQFVKQRNWNFINLMNVPGSPNNMPIQLLDVWSPENPKGTFMPYTSGSNEQKNTQHFAFMQSTAAISDASFLRLKNVQLSYRIPLNESFLRDAKIYFQGQNLWTLTKYFGVDPEVPGAWLPPLKTYSFGVQLIF